MNMENNCKWFFPICGDGAHERGLNNAMSEHFKSQSQYTTLVRESIQNSLDAVLDENKPVIVKFSFLPLKNPFETMPQLMGIKKHIQGCIDYWSSNSEIYKQYQPMLSYINDSKEALSYLRVSDFNTKGMDYKKDDNNCTFFAFLRAEGTSVKNMINSGGSFGFGKMAYFGLSNFRTILVSTMNELHEVSFEGAAMLCTNKVDGIKYMDVGYYDSNKGTPITVSDDIPVLFRRTEPGTDINIMGISFSHNMMEDHKKEIIKSVLTHFWMAIHERKLEVYMGGIHITHDTLHSLMLSNFGNKLDVGTKYENPRAYYETVIGVEEKRNDCRLFEEYVDGVGSCRFYIARNRGSRDRYIAMRNPLMVVQQFNSQSSRGYSGVFICDDKNGNELLKMTEPPAHDKWDRNRVLDKYSRSDKKARKALSEVRRFSLSCVSRFFQAAEEDVTEIRGIDQFLYMNSSENNSNDIGQYVNSNEGHRTSEYTDVENGAPIGSINSQSQSSTTVNDIGHITVKDTVNASLGGDMLSGKSDRSLRTKSSNPRPRSGTSNVNHKKRSDDDGVKSNVEHLIEVKYRCFVLEKTEGIVHKLVFYAERDFENVVLRLKSATIDPNKFEEIPLIWASVGNVIDNRIECVHVFKGKNIVMFSFNDKLAHAVNLEAYYEEE